MSLGPTLNSRLRVLVAKAFRAEKLYSSVNSSRAERLTNLAVIAEAASDIRAREWQRTHYQLRTSLNDILGLGSSPTVVREVVALRESFLKRSMDALSMVEKGAEDLIETTRRHEFAHIFKISAELIRLKAQAQACRAVADELSTVLEASNQGEARQHGLIDRLNAARANGDRMNGENPSDIDQRIIRAESDDVRSTGSARSDGSFDSELNQPTNVIQLNRRVGSRKR